MSEPQFTFFQVVTNSGRIGIIIWMMIFALSLAGVVLGVLSVVSALRLRTNKYPLALKLLFCVAAATFLAGAFGTVTGYADAVAKLANPAISNRARMLTLSTRMADVCIEFAFLAALAHFVSAIFALLVIERRSKLLGMAGLSFRERTRWIPALAYLMALPLVPALLGSCLAFRSQIEMITLKQSEIPPLFLGMDIATVLKICLACAFAGAALALVQMCLSLFFPRFVEKNP